ncbi:RNA polymerase sigma factor [uncultured Jatrophihabitans sp.]|uniref:RNA polymerase sigma factor n=1 Tax=uncultured Jatrophihabitans sp. TaxID=1610747 RepID=UPI0035C99770
MTSSARSRESADARPGVVDVPLDFAAHRSTMFRFAVTLSSLDDADDLVQDALARAWTKRAQFDPDRGSLRSWLLAIVADQARSRWRRRRPVEELLDPGALTVPGADTSTPHSADLHAAIRRLPPRQRAAIVLHHFVDLSVVDAAAVMGCSAGTVKSTLHDARAALAHALGESYATD